MRRGMDTSSRAAASAHTIRPRRLRTDGGDVGGPRTGVNESPTRRELLHQMGGLAVTGALSRVGALPTPLFASKTRGHPMLHFAEAEVVAAARAANRSALKLSLELDPSLGEQAYRIEQVNTDTLLVTGGDTTGVM